LCDVWQGFFLSRPLPLCFVFFFFPPGDLSPSLSSHSTTRPLSMMLAAVLPFLLLFTQAELALLRSSPPFWGRCPPSAEYMIGLNLPFCCGFEKMSPSFQSSLRVPLPIICVFFSFSRPPPRLFLRDRRRASTPWPILLSDALLALCFFLFPSPPGPDTSEALSGSLARQSTPDA